MELKQVGERTYYIENPTNIGIYLVDDKHVFLIDTGNDKESGKKILKIVTEKGWEVVGIITTHSNADHVGGNKLIQDRTNCKIYSYGIEKCITEYPLIEPSFLYGAYPFDSIRNNKFLMAKPSVVTDIDNNLPTGLEYIVLRGHFFDMIGIKTSDDVIFLGDSLFSEETITKYHIFFIYDVSEYLNTLNMLKELPAKMYIPSHCKATNNITDLIKLNEDKINEILDYLYNLCKEKMTFEDILKHVFDDYNLVINITQYVLISCTIKSYLSYLKDQSKLTYEFIDNKMYWKQIEV